MRYPLWAFLFVFLLPPFALHATLAGKAQFVRPVASNTHQGLPTVFQIATVRHSF